jgi:hypothetical protein
MTLIIRGILLPCEKMPAGYPRIGSAMFLRKFSSTQSLSASNFSNICCHVVRNVCQCVKYFFVKRKWCVPRFKFLRPLIEARHSYILNVAVFRIQELLGLEAR